MFVGLGLVLAVTSCDHTTGMMLYVIYYMLYIVCLRQIEVYLIVCYIYCIHDMLYILKVWDIMYCPETRSSEAGSECTCMKWNRSGMVNLHCTSCD